MHAVWSTLTYFRGYQYYALLDLKQLNLVRIWKKEPSIDLFVFEPVTWPFECISKLSISG